MKTKEQYQFSLAAFLWSALAWVVIVGLAVVGLLSPAMDAFDKWAEHPKNQFIIGIVCVLSVCLLLARRIMKKIFNRE